MLPILTVNIGAASLDRAKMLLDWLAGRPEDVIALTETSAGPGTAFLLDQFRRAGYAVVNTPDDGDRGAALVSRIPVLDPEPFGPDSVSIPGRLAAAVLDTDPPVTVTGVYVPSRDRSATKTDRKQRFVASLLEALAGLPDEHRAHLVLCGDYNVIARTHQPLHTGFLPFEFAMLDTLAELGLIDAHEQCAPGVQAYSWIGRTGDGYRYDYFHIGHALGGLLDNCAYLHETRDNRLTDHAATTLTLRVHAARLDTRDPAQAAQPGEITLF